jgi:hypothetical protein
MVVSPGAKVLDGQLAEGWGSLPQEGVRAFRFSGEFFLLTIKISFIRSAPEPARRFTHEYK